MDFASYADRARGFDLRPLTTDILRKLARLFDRGVSLADLHAQYARELGSHDLQAYRKAREVWHEHQRWQQSVREMVARRSEAGRLLLLTSIHNLRWLGDHQHDEWGATDEEGPTHGPGFSLRDL